MNEELLRAIRKVQRRRCLTGEDIVTLNRICGERFWRALQAVANNLVKRYVFEPSRREAWVVVGKNRDYRVLPDVYCDCEDFYINVIVKRRAETCYHILARILAEALNTFSVIRVDDMLYETLNAEWEALPPVRSSAQRQS